MKNNLKNLVTSLVLSASVLAISQVYAADAVAPTSVESIANAKQALSEVASSPTALTAKVKALLATTSPAAIAAALAELKIAPAVALQAMVGAGVPVVYAVSALVAANPDSAPAVTNAAIALAPEAKSSIIQAAISAGASPDVATGSAAGPSTSAPAAPQGSSPASGSSGGGGGGVVVPTPPVSAS